MIHVNPSRVQNRRACNRCHQAKLKCVVAEGSLQCQRCKRCAVECAFSPPTRVVQNQQQQKQQRQRHLRRQHDATLQSRPIDLSTTAAVAPSTGGIAAMDMDWDFLMEPQGPGTTANTFTFDTNDYPHNGTLSNTLISPDQTMPCQEHSCNTDSISHLNLDHTNNSKNDGDNQNYDEQLSYDAFFNFLSTTNSNTVSESSTSHPHNTRSDDSSSLPSTAASILPSLQGNLIEVDSHNDQPTNDPASWVARLAPLHVLLTEHLKTMPHVETLDPHPLTSPLPPPSNSHDTVRTFELSETFVTLLSAMASMLSPSTSSTPSSSSPRSTILSSASPSTFLPLDEPTYLLLFATYLRFLEMQDAVYRYMLAFLTHMRSMSREQGNSTSSATQKCFLPKLSIGSFSLDVASGTRPLLFVNLMESMLARATTSMQRLASVKTPTGNFSFAFPTIVEPDAALRAVQYREAALSSLNKRFKDAFSQSRTPAY